MSRRLRLLVLVLGGLAVAAALGAIVVVYLLLQPDRFTAMLQTQARGAGLELSLASPASPTLFPRPALDLRGITLSAEGAHAPILLAPRVDLDALQAWMAALPTQVQHAPPNIPRIDTGVEITHGSLVRGNEVLLDNLSLRAGSLISGQPFPLHVTTTVAGSPWQLRLSATPRIEGNALQLNDISLHLSQAAAVSLSLNGRARWHGAADAAANQDDPLLLALKLDGPDNHADLRLPPLALARWWSQLDDPKGLQLGIPPGSGHAEFGSIDAGGVHIEGLRMLAGDNVPVAAGTSAATAGRAGAALVPAR